MAVVIRTRKIGDIEPFEDSEPGVALCFYRAANEDILPPGDLLALLRAEGVEIGIPRGRNPITHDQWWVPVVGMAKANAPYAVALMAVIRTWLKERKGRQVKLEVGAIKISAGTAAEVESMLKSLTKHQDKLGALYVTKAQRATIVLNLAGMRSLQRGGCCLRQRTSNSALAVRTSRRAS